MKTIINTFFKIMTFHYILFVILGLLLLPIIFIVGGFKELIETYFKNGGVTVNTYKIVKKEFWSKK